MPRLYAGLEHHSCPYGDQVRLDYAKGVAAKSGTPRTFTLSGLLHYMQDMERCGATRGDVNIIGGRKRVLILARLL